MNPISNIIGNWSLYENHRTVEWNFDVSATPTFVTEFSNILYFFCSPSFSNVCCSRHLCLCLAGPCRYLGCLNVERKHDWLFLPGNHLRLWLLVVYFHSNIGMCWAITISRLWCRGGLRELWISGNMKHCTPTPSSLRWFTLTNILGCLIKFCLIPLCFSIIE